MVRLPRRRRKAQWAWRARQSATPGLVGDLGECGGLKGWRRQGAFQAGSSPQHNILAILVAPRPPTPPKTFLVASGLYFEYAPAELSPNALYGANARLRSPHFLRKRRPSSSPNAASRPASARGLGAARGRAWQRLLLPQGVQDDHVGTARNAPTKGENDSPSHSHCWRATAYAKVARVHDCVGAAVFL